MPGGANTLVLLCFQCQKPVLNQHAAKKLRRLSGSGTTSNGSVLELSHLVQQLYVKVRAEVIHALHLRLW